MPWSLTAATGTVMVSPPQSSGAMPRSCIWRLHAVEVGAFHVHLVDRDDERDLGVLHVLQRLVGLRHETVVGRHHQHGDVGDAGAAGAHLVEGGVAGRVEEGDLAALELDLVGADVLGDAARLAGGDVGLADGVEQRGLAVVDVAEDAHHRRARLEELGLVLHGLLHLFLGRQPAPPPRRGA